MERNSQLLIRDYTEYPGPRYIEQGESSGEDFYHSQLNDAFAKAIEQNKVLEVILDGTAGFASSFLDEAFGNLVFDFTRKIVERNLIITSKEEPDWKDMISNDVFSDWEIRRIDQKVPKKTKTHGAWYRWENDKLEKNVWL